MTILEILRDKTLEWEAGWNPEAVLGKKKSQLDTCHL